jgi:hypothetical protein
MAKSKKNSQIRLPINTLSSGVGRQAPSKRLPSEAENIDNAFVTLERSISKRAGSQIISEIDGTRVDLGITDILGKDLWFFWFDLSEESRYLIIVDFNAENSSDRLLWIFRVLASGWKDISPDNGIISSALRSYLTYRPVGSTTNARQSLKGISVGQDVLLLNRNVKAGFSSTDSGPAFRSSGTIGTWEYDIIEGGTGYDSTTEYTTTSDNGSGLICKVSQSAGVVDGILDIINAGNDYQLNELVTIGSGGATVRLLNPQNYLYNYDGSTSTTVDSKGKPIGYYTSATQDPQAKATEWNTYEDYLAGDLVVYGSGGSDRKIYEANQDITGTGGADNPVTATTEWDEQRDAQLLLVEDWVYPDVENLDLGQALSDFSEIKFPPLSTDMTANNGASRTGTGDRTEAVLAALYPDTGDSGGRGKVYFVSGTYLSTLPGYYRIISKTPEDGGKGRPYTQRVRTPDKHSYLDINRMPVLLSLVDTDSFKLEPVSWDTRTTGSIDSNPGPSVFTNRDGTLRHIEINSMAFYRGRLFLSAADTLFSSRIGDFDNLWLNDPANITSGDPLDLQASSNKYSRINSMIPFSDYLFINTDSDTQFELLGSENQITPFTAELAPTAFYSTSPMVDPVLMGSQIYFFSPNRMYLYFSSEASNLNTAVEVSSHCPNYIPSDYAAVGVAASRDTIIFVDNDDKSKMYFYTNRFSGDRVIQNSFSRWILKDTAEVLGLTFFDDDLYTITSQQDSAGTSYLYLEKTSMSDEEYDIPRIDHKYLLTLTESNASYSSVSDSTTYTVPYLDPLIDEVIFQVGWGEEEYTRQAVVSVTDDPVAETTDITISGNYSTVGNKIYFGRMFEMNVELSPLFYRDKENNVVNGVLNLRTLSTRHFNTGNYTIDVNRRERSAFSSIFNVNQIDSFNTTLSNFKLYEEHGEFTSKVYGYASEIQIFIKSDFPTPCNITNIELRGFFKPTYSSVLD